MHEMEAHGVEVTVVAVSGQQHPNDSATIASQLSSSPSTIMTGREEPDFDEEWKKHIEKTKLFEEVLIKKKELDNLTPTVREKESKLNALLQDFYEIDIQLKSLKFEEEQLRCDAATKEEEWRKSLDTDVRASFKTS
jgi:hypothetical protein